MWSCTDARHQIVPRSRSRSEEKDLWYCVMISVVSVCYCIVLITASKLVALDDDNLRLNLNTTTTGNSVIYKSCPFDCLSKVIEVTVTPRAGSRVVRIDPLRFLAGCHKRRLNQVLSVLSPSLGFF